MAKSFGAYRIVFIRAIDPLYPVFINKQIAQIKLSKVCV